MKLPSWLRIIDKNWDDLTALNTTLKPYGINVYYVKRGWRAFRLAGGNGVCQTQICWMGDGVTMEWFANPHQKAEEFLEKFNQ